MIRLVVLGALALLSADVPPADLPSAKRAEAFSEAHGHEMDEAKTEAICRRVANLKPPLSDQPTPAEVRALKGCDSEALYYGIGMPADPVRARKCAFASDDDQQPYHLHDREGLLMMIYANGRGVSRNMELAIHYACELADSAFARDFRVRDLDERETTAWRGTDFESCEHITSGLAQGYCMGHDARLAEQSRQKRISAFAKSWTRQQRRLFDQAYQSADAYAGALHEMDCFRGTAQAACAIAGADEVMGEFTDRIEALAAGDIAGLKRRILTEKKRIAREAQEAGVDGSDDDYDYGDDQKWYDENDRDTAAKRVRFERALVAFARSTFPTVTSHQIRQIFADM